MQTFKGISASYRQTYIHLTSHYPPPTTCVRTHTHTLMLLVLQTGTLRLCSEHPRDQEQAGHHPIIAVQTSSPHTHNTDKVPVLLPAGTGGSKERRGGGGCGTEWGQPRKAERKGRWGLRHLQSLCSWGRQLPHFGRPALSPSSAASVHLHPS